MEKNIQKKLSKTFVLVDLLISELDDINFNKTEQTNEILDNCNKLKKTLEPILEKFYDNDSVKKTIFFITLQNKFNYIFDKEYK